MIADPLQRFVYLEDQKAHLKSQLEGVQKEMDELQGPIMDKFEKECIDKITIKGRTIYLESRIWASLSKDDPQRALDLFRANGKDSYISERVNANQISVMVREFVNEETGEIECTAWMNEAMKISEVQKIRSRKA